MYRRSSFKTTARIRLPTNIIIVVVVITRKKHLWLPNSGPRALPIRDTGPLNGSDLSPLWARRWSIS